MKSSSGNYYIGLDHIRAIAVFMVFTWHFIHVNNGQFSPPLPFFPLSLLTEGHTGVSLFMVLSGYLFTKLLDGKRINYASFIYNRFLRLAPLLILVILYTGYIVSISGGDLLIYAKSIITGILAPSFPNGGWSITVEFHFYLLLPFLLFLSRKWKHSLLFILIMAISTRGLMYYELGSIQKFSYYTLIGRIDQFLLGIMAYQYRKYIAGKHLLTGCAFGLYLIFYWYFDLQGGFYKTSAYPSPSSIWIYLPTVEGTFYALIICWYDNSFKHSSGKISRFIASIGTYAYSIYLLHFFIVFDLATAINNHIMKLTNNYLSLLWAPIGFLLILPIAYISYRFIEAPFLKLRTRYIITDDN